MAPLGFVSSFHGVCHLCRDPIRKGTDRIFPVAREKPGDHGQPNGRMGGSPTTEGNEGLRSTREEKAVGDALGCADTGLDAERKSDRLQDGDAESANERPLVWVHLNCALEGNLVSKEVDRPVCRHWKRKGLCLYGAECFFRHPPEEAGTMVAPPKRAWGGKRAFVRNRCRVSIFRRFLIDTYGLRSGHHVLDVAGGKGELGFELTNLTGVRTTVVEPRALCVQAFASRFEKGVYHRNLKHCAAKYVARSSRERILPVDHVRMFLDRDVVAKLDPGAPLLTGPELEAALHKARNSTYTSKGCSCHEDGDIVPGSSTADDDAQSSEGDNALANEISDIEGVLDRLTRFDIVVGMHPDQATEPLVDLAIKLGKPFAVVPCCVFAKTFTNRYLSGGQQVTSYEDFIRYLVEKDPGTVTSRKLDFEGKNVVVYRMTGVS